MRKAIAHVFVLVILLCALMQTACAAGLNHRAHITTLLNPASKYDYQAFLDNLDQFAAEHPSLMPGDQYAILSAIGSEAVELFSSLDVKYDPFEENYIVYDSEYKEPSEDHPLIFHVSGGTFYYDIALYSESKWIKATSITFLLDGKRYSDETNFSQEYITCEDNRRLELIVGTETYYGGFPPEQLTESAAFRVYGRNGDQDVFCGDYIVDHYNKLHAASTMNKRISDALWDWCRAIDAIVE